MTKGSAALRSQHSPMPLNLDCIEVYLKGKSASFYNIESPIP